MELNTTAIIPREVAMPQEIPEGISQKKWQKISIYNYFLNIKSNLTIK